MKKINLQSIEALLSGYWLSDLSNFASYIYNNMDDLNWVGFYLSDGKELKLGPFMGNPACLKIPFNKGVCGKAFTEADTIIVNDVHNFEGHISCDPNSRSELVIPLYINSELAGVLDIDSPKNSQFTEMDKVLIENAIKILSHKISNYNGTKYGTI